MIDIDALMAEKGEPFIVITPAGAFYYSDFEALVARLVADGREAELRAIGCVGPEEFVITLPWDELNENGD